MKTRLKNLIYGKCVLKTCREEKVENTVLYKQDWSKILFIMFAKQKDYKHKVITENKNFISLWHIATATIFFKIYMNIHVKINELVFSFKAIYFFYYETRVITIIINPLILFIVINFVIFITAHEVGLVTLQVACEGFVISNSVIFEYKKPPSDENKVKEVNWI